MLLTDVIARLAEFTDDAVLIAEAAPIDHPGPRVIWCNEAFTRMTGFAADEIIGQTPRILQGVDTSPEVKARISDRLKAWQPVREQIKNYRRDGTPFWVDLGIRPVADEHGWFHYWVAIQRDITKQKETELALLLAQKMEAVGQLSAGVAHDFNNILTAIIGSLDVLERIECADARFRPLVERIKSAADRGASVTRQLLAVARPGAIGAMANVGVNDEIRRALDLLLMSGGRKIQVQTALCADEPVVRADAGLFGSALLNLMINARDAMSDGGVLSVTTSVQMDAIIGVPMVSINIADTGVGMSPELQEKVFAPFFTTKGENGTGLGLSMVRRFVDEAGGRISLDSALGKGTTFVLTFPVTGLQPQSPVRGALEDPASVNRRVLVMDADSAVAHAITIVLRDEGFSVLATIDLNEARRALAREEFSVVLIDPARLAPPIELHSTKTPILILSSEMQGIARNEWPVLQKPFNAAALMRAVRKAAGLPPPQPNLFSD